MTRMTTNLVALAAGLLIAPLAQAGDWLTMFDGKTLDGWKVNIENPDRKYQSGERCALEFPFQDQSAQRDDQLAQ